MEVKKLIKNINEFKEWKSNTKEGTVECECEKCHRIFKIRKEYGKGSKSSNHYYRLSKMDELICPWCYSSSNFKKTRSLKSEDQLRKEQEKKTQARLDYFNNRYKEDSAIVYKTFNDLKKAYDEGKKGASYVCENCNKTFVLKDRSTFRLFIKTHERLLCKGCSISLTKSSKNFEKIKEKTDNCVLLPNQNYTGSKLEKKAEERPKFKFRCDSCRKEFESPFFPNHPVRCPYCDHQTSTSKEEKEILNYIKSIYNGLILENDRRLINPLEVDILIPGVQLAIEYDGLYWHGRKDPLYHLKKTLLCESKGFKLLHILPSDDKKLIRDLLYNYLNEIPFEFEEDVRYDRRLYSVLDVSNYVSYSPTCHKTDGYVLDKGDLEYWDCGYFEVSDYTKLSPEESLLSLKIKNKKEF